MDNPIHDLIKIQYIRQGYLPNIPYHLISDIEMLDAFLAGVPSGGFMPNNYDILSKEVLVRRLDSKYANLTGYFINNYPCPNTEDLDLKLSYYWIIESILNGIKYISNGFGDINGDGFVDLADFDLLMKIVVETVDPTPEQEKRADLNGDGKVNTKDINAFKQLFYSRSYENHHLNDVVINDWIYSFMLGIPISDSSDIRDKHNFLTLIDMDNIYDTFDEATAKKCNEISTKYLKDHHITDRTPSVFGEPHVVKAARLEDARL